MPFRQALLTILNKEVNLTTLDFFESIAPERFTKKVSQEVNSHNFDKGYKLNWNVKIIMNEISVM